MFRDLAHPQSYGVRATAEKTRAEPPLGGHSKSQTLRVGRVRTVQRIKPNQIQQIVFGSETPAHPSFLCSIVFWLWRGRGMRLLVCGVSL